MNISFIQPPLLEKTPQKISSRVEVEVPLGIAYLAGSLEQNGHTCQIIDSIIDGYGKITQHEGYHVFGLTFEEITNKTQSFASELVGISCIFFSQIKSALFLAKSIKQANPALKIVMGGIGAFQNVKTVMASGWVDYIVIGEGEQTLVDLVSALTKDEQTEKFGHIDGLIFMKGNKKVENPKHHYIDDLDTLPSPAYHLFDLENYFKIGIPFANKKKQPLHQYAEQSRLSVQLYLLRRSQYMVKEDKAT